MTLLITYLLVALVFSFFCSITEAVLLSLRPSFIRALEDRNPRGARILKHLRADPDRPLSAILTVNTIAHTVGAAGVGAQVAAVYGDNHLGLASAILTLLILVFSEIIPKSLGAVYWKQLALPLAPAILWLTRLLAPAVWASRQITRMMIGGSGAGHATFSRAEFEAMADVAAEEGQIDGKQRQIVGNILRLGDVRVRQIMTPRSVMFSCPEDITVRDFLNRHSDRPFSRIPVYAGSSTDDITGYVLKDDILLASVNGKDDTPLAQCRRDFMGLPDTMAVLEAFNRMAQDHQHVVLILDEYGTVQGLMSLEDVLETMIGQEIVDETDSEPDMQQLARRKWRDRLTSLKRR